MKERRKEKGNGERERVKEYIMEEIKERRDEMIKNIHTSTAVYGHTPLLVASITIPCVLLSLVLIFHIDLYY